MMNKFMFFINERENVRVRQQRGDPKPWTTDEMLLTYRFCNVRREDDKVTRWIDTFWRKPYEGHINMTKAMLLARMVNWPDTLADIGFPEQWDKDVYADKIGKRMAGGSKTWTGAYMITAESDGTPKHISVCETVDQCVANTFLNCLDAWNYLQTLPRIGSFMAAQVVADLKHTHVLRNAPDKDTFCAPGPGSQRGLAILKGLPETTQWSQPKFEAEVNPLRAEVSRYTGLYLDAQDVQNCLCEFSKYNRGSSRSKYDGH